MNFLNPIILYALGAAALPVIIHLLSRRRTKEVAFPSIEFLERMKTDRMRRLRLKQLLMILLRTLIIVMIILAFARPAVNNVFKKNARTSAVIIIDGSASMMYVHNGEALFAGALRKAREILNILENDDTAAVILSNDVPALIGPGMTADKKKLFEAINELENPLTVSDATKSFAMASDILASSTDPNMEMYYITDYAVNSIPDSLPPLKNFARVYTIRLGPETRSSSVIKQVELKERLLTPGKPVTFQMQGVLGPEENEVNVELFVNGERKMRSLAERRSGDIIETEFSYTPDVTGWYSVYTAVNDGRFEPGETRRCVIHIPEKAKVILTGDSPQDLYFLGKALDPDPERSMFLIKKVLADSLSLTDVSQADVVVLAGVKSLPVSIYKSLLTAVAERGTGLVVFPPSDMEKSLYANGIFRDMFPAKVEKRVMVSKKSGSYAVIDWFDMTHPILRGVSGEGKFQKPAVTSYIRMRPAGNVTVIGRFNDGFMALGNAVCGKGRVVVFAVDSSTGSSELPLTGIFVPLFIRTVQHLSGTDTFGGSYEIGDIINEFIGDISEQTPVYIKPDDGPARSVEISHSENGTIVKGGTAARPGFYSIYAGDEERVRYCVNIPLSEVVYKRADTQEPVEDFKDVRWRVIDETENLTERLVKDRYGTELFSLFMILAAGLFAVEMALSRKV